MNDGIILYTKQPALLSQWKNTLQTLSSPPPIVPTDDAHSLNSALNRLTQPLILFHRQSPEDDPIINRLLQIHKDILILENLPNDASGLAWLEKGAKGYLNTHAHPDRLKQAVHSILTGHVWVGQQLLQKMIQLLHQDTQPKSDNPPSSPPAWQQHLTDREVETIEHILKGESNQQIAKALNISERTVKAHLHNIFEKLGVKDRLALALFILGGNHEVTTHS